LHIVHRDMSPPNVLITKHGEVKIVDFGLAKANSQLEKSEPGIIKGKFSYLSPEAAMAQEVDARTDVFAVGIILWELLAGQRLFLGDTDFQTVKKVQASVVPPISQINRRVPPELERIIQRALARDPTQRFQTARALGVELSRFLFTFAVPVSTFDIGLLVQGAMKERQRYRPTQTSIIDKLIEEALLEFTSLTDDKPVHPSKPVQLTGLAPGNHAALPGGGYLGSWIDEIAVGTKREDSQLHKSLPMGLAVGNLAALEDEPLHVPAPPRQSPPNIIAAPAPSSSAALPIAPAPSPSSAPLVAPSAPPDEARRANPATMVGVLVALVVVMAAGAAAWFTHLIPHP
jgi:serine/threonine-protein kinase